MTEPAQHIPPMARVAIVGAGAIGLWIGLAGAFLLWAVYAVAVR